MMELAGYFVKVTVCLTVFALVYHTCLRKLTFFDLSRIYLLASLAFSFIIPLLHVEYERYERIETISSLKDVSIISDYFAGHEMDLSAEQQMGSDPVQTGIVIYSLISLFLFAQLIRRITGIFIYANKTGIRIGKILMVPPLGKLLNCSFFNMVFIDRKNLSPEELDQVLVHEYEHIKRFHSVDKLFIELLRVVMWFNPLIYYFRYRLAEIHEFEVDAVVSTRFNKRQYASMILKLSSGVSLMFTNNFSRNKLEFRINRLFSHKSLKMKKLLYLSFFPVLTVLGFYLSVQVVYARIYKDPDPGTWKVQPVEDPAKSKSSTESITPFSTEEHLVPVKEKLLLTEENERGELITVSAGYKAIEPSVRTESGNLVLRTDPGKILKVVLDPGHGGRDDASQVAVFMRKI